MPPSKHARPLRQMPQRTGGIPRPCRRFHVPPVKSPCTHRSVLSEHAQWQSLRCFAGIDSQLGDFDQVTMRRDMATPTGTDFRPGAVAGSPGYFTLNSKRPSVESTRQKPGSSNTASMQAPKPMISTPPVLGRSCNSSSRKAFSSSRPSWEFPSS